MGLLGGLIGGWSQASAYDAKKREAQARGRAEKSAAYAKATAREVASRQNARLDALNMMRLREQESEAAGAVRSARGAAGFDMSSGSGGAAEAVVHEQAQEAVNDAALSSSIGQMNAFNEAVGLRRMGDAAQRSADAEAAQYRAMAKGTRRGMWVSGTLGLIGGAARGIMDGTFETIGRGTGSFMDGAGRAWQGANAAFSMGASVNPFMAKYSDAGWESTLADMYGQARRKYGNSNNNNNRR